MRTLAFTVSSGLRKLACALTPARAVHRRIRELCGLTPCP